MSHASFPIANLFYEFTISNARRQKSSGADGERLREAANINKSLSTLG